jgi:hypothetical protein
MKKQQQNVYKQPQKTAVPQTSGYPEKGVKTAGVKIRGTGAATKGTMARGPMA